MKFSICIDMLFDDQKFEDRITTANKLGFSVVEFWKWSNKNIIAISNILKNLNMRTVLLNLDSANPELSYDLSRGIINAGRKAEFLNAIYETLPVVEKLDCDKLIILAGQSIENLSFEQQFENMFDCLSASERVLKENGITLLVEPLNTIDRAGYFMPYSRDAFRLLNELSCPNIKLLYDIYHQQIMEGDLIRTIKNNIDSIGHFHVADNPGRHEPGTGEINYNSVFQAIDETNYPGYVGLEFRPINTEFNISILLKNGGNSIV